MRPEPWEDLAPWWQEHFTEGADPEYAEQILPALTSYLRGSRVVLDLGCGEGQVCRALAKGAASAVVGIDRSAQQLSMARQRGGEPYYLRCDAGRLPFGSASFDSVVVCLVLEHLPDTRSAIAEIGRVLAPSGRVVIVMNHPFLQGPGSGWVDDRILDEQYWRVGPYLVEGPTSEEVDKGVFVTFYHRPLARYVNDLVAAGLFVTHLDEPGPPEGLLARAPEYAEAVTIPRMMIITAERLSRVEARWPGAEMDPGGPGPGHNMTSG